MIKQVSSFLEKAIGRIQRLDPESIPTMLDHLQRQYAFLETLFNTIHDGVLVIDDRGRISYVNRAASSMLGFSASQVDGENDSRFLPDPIRRRLGSLDGADAEPVHTFEAEIDYPERRYLHVTVVALDRRIHETGGVVLVLQDATQSMREKQEAVESERGQALHLMAASVAHELGNPLNALQIHFQLAERQLGKLEVPEGDPPGGAEKLREYLRIARSELTRLDYTVRQYLGAVRPVQLERKLIDLNWVVKDTLDLLRPEIGNRGLEVVLRLDPGPVRALLDASQIKQILIT